MRPSVSGAQSAFLPALLSCSGIENRTAKQLQENLVWLKLEFLKYTISFPPAAHPNLGEGRYKQTVCAQGTEGWNSFPRSAGLFLLGVQHEQSCILTDRLSSVEEAVLALRGGKRKEPSQKQAALCHFYSNGQQEKPVWERNFPLSSYFSQCCHHHK